MSTALWRGAPLRLGPLRLPRGGSLPTQMWTRLHAGILALLAGHAVGLAAYGLYAGAKPLHALVEGGLVGVIALLAAWPRIPRRARSVVAAFGLMSSSAILVHLSGGYIEAHFHFFVMLGIIFLYEDWLPYVLAVAYVALHHGVAGSLDPLSVYNHPGAIASPWTWAGIHAVFILGLSSALLVAWNVIERAREAEQRALSEAQELKRQVLTQEKMAALGSLVAGLAHEVRTPVTVASTNASILEIAAAREPDNALSARVIAHAQEIRASMDRINALVLQLRRFHALAPEELQQVPLHAVVKEAVRLFSTANKASRAIRVDLAETPPSRLHPLGVHQVALNLLTNAVEATDAVHGVVTVATRVEDGWAVLSISDNGIGMSAHTQRQAFDPLFTTKQEGMGLGLHIVRRIVDAHGGEIRLRSREGEGTTIEVLFPLAAQGTPVPVVTTDATRSTGPAPLPPSR